MCFWHKKLKVLEMKEFKIQEINITCIKFYIKCTTNWDYWAHIIIRHETEAEKKNLIIYTALFCLNSVKNQQVILVYLQ